MFSADRLSCFLKMCCGALKIMRRVGSFVATKKQHGCLPGGRCVDSAAALGYFCSRGCRLQYLPWCTLGRYQGRDAKVVSESSQDRHHITATVQSRLPRIPDGLGTDGFCGARWVSRLQWEVNTGAHCREGVLLTKKRPVHFRGLPVTSFPTTTIFLVLHIQTHDIFSIE